MRIAYFAGLGWVASFFLLACGAEQSAGAPPEEGEGSVHIIVQNVDKVDDVRSIVVTLQPQPSGAPVVVPLESPQPGDTDWNQTVSNIPAGTYQATAVAEDSQSKVLFISAAIPITVTHGNTTNATIFMIQDLKDDAVETPYITSVVFLSAPVQGLPVDIVVTGGGGRAGALTLSGYASHGSFQAASGDARSGATIRWTPASNLLQQEISLTVADVGTNGASVSMVVPVSPAEGFVDFTVSFNHAPVANILFDGHSQDDAVKVAIMVTYDDVEYDMNNMNLSLINYAWDFSDCENEGLKLNEDDSDNVGLPLGIALVPPDNNTQQVFILEAEDGTITYECEAVVHVRDRNTQGTSERIQTLLIKTGAFTTTIPPAP